ncbi:MAG: YeeE/YedE thiosulfate transporter family protein [Candidatus Krumholzibacteria bacterium]|nr:YeeE/YedE thiosulfate transporter family protein [Candidatus Krumholzibacteria bacterium]
MLSALHARRKTQLLIGLLAGVVFGFLLQKGGATKYDVIVGQLLLRDFTVVKIMVSAVITGMIGVHALSWLGLARLHPKSGSWGGAAVGGLIFGVGFAALGYCPGTVAGAVGNGHLDALAGGVVGMLAGAGTFAALFPRLQRGILSRGMLGDLRLHAILGIPEWATVIPAALVLALALLALERAGL